MNAFEALETEIELAAQALKSTGATPEDSKGLYPDLQPPAGSCPECHRSVYRAQVSTTAGPRFQSFDRTLAGLGNHEILKELHSFGHRWIARHRRWGDYRLHICSGEPEMDWSPEARAAIEAPAGAVKPMTDAMWFVGNIDGDAA